MFLAILMLAGIIAAVVFYTRAREQQYARNALRGLLEETERHLTIVMQERERFAYAYSFNPTIVTALKEKLSIQTDYSALRALIQVLNAPYASFEYLHSVSLVSYVNQSIFSNRGRMDLSEYSDTDFLEWLAGQGRESVWIADREMTENEGRPNLVFTHVLGLPIGAKTKSGWLVFNYQLHAFLTPVLNVRDMPHLKVLILTDTERQNGCHTIGDTALTVNQWSDLFYGRILEHKRSNKDSGEFIMAQEIPSRNWWLVVRSPVATYGTASIRPLEIIVIIGIIILFTALLMCRVLAVYFSGPIRSLVGLIPGMSNKEATQRMRVRELHTFVAKHLKDTISETLIRNQHYEEMLHEYDRTLAAHERLVREKAVLDYVVNRAGPGDSTKVVLEPYISACTKTWTFLVVILRFRDPKPFLKWIEFQERICGHARRSLGAADVLLARLDHLSYIGVLVFGGMLTGVEDRVREKTGRIIALLASRRSGPILHVGIGGARRTFAEVCDSYQEATAVMEALRWESHSSVQHYDAAAQYLIDPKLHQEYAILRERLLLSIRARDADTAHKVFESIITLASSDEATGSPNRTTMLGQVARDLTLENTAAYSGVTTTRNSLIELNRIRGCGDLIDWMRSLIDDTIDRLDRRLESRHADLVQRVVEYLHEHFAEPVMLQTIEDRFGITMSHFGKIFREQTGTTFHRYLTEVRLRSAMDLLRSTDYPLRVIAGVCGFENRHNLIRVFRRLRGVTPTEFRRAEHGFVS